MRRSQRLADKMSSENKAKMSSFENIAQDQEPQDELSLSGSDERTIVESPDPSVKDLKLEILTLKNVMINFMDSVNKMSLNADNNQLPILPTNLDETTAKAAAETLPNTYSSMPNTTAEGSIHQADKNYEGLAHIQTSTATTTLVTNTSAEPNKYMHTQNQSEYSMPLPSIQSFVPPPTPFSMPYFATQTNPRVDTYSLHSTPQPMPAISYGLNTTRMCPMVTQPHMPHYATTTNLPLTTPQVSGIQQPIRKLHDLPEFSGQPEQWPMFINSFRETTQFYGYSSLENLIRLQKSLKGSARTVVESSLITPESVPHVISTLEFHYGRPQTLIRSQISKVRSFPAISSKKPLEIVDFSIMVSNLAAFLQNAKATPHLNNPTLLDELINKLPLHRREEWIEHSINNLGQYPSVTEFSSWLHKVATYTSLAIEIDPYKNEVTYNKRDKISSSFTIIGDNKHTECVMCHQDHPLYSCKKFKETNTASRWNLAKEKRLCFGCLRGGHTSSQCPMKRRCGLYGCTRFHNRLLHEGLNLHAQANENVNNVSADDCDDEEPISSQIDNRPVNTITDESINKGTYFKFLPVRLRGPRGVVEIIAFIDEGSKITLLEDETAYRLGLKGDRSNLRLGWIGGKTTDEVSQRVQMEIMSNVSNGNEYHMKNVWTTRNLDLPPQSLEVNYFRKKMPQIVNTNIENYNGKPRMLIGLPHIHLVRPYEIINLDESFAVHKTKLGNVFFGSNDDSVDFTVCRIDCKILDGIQRQVSEYFEIENLGVKHVETIISDEDKRSLEILRTRTVKAGNRYESGLLWRDDSYEYKSTYETALKRLVSLENKMKKDKELADWYNRKMNEYIDKLYVRKLSDEECNKKEDRTWYLPHFVITNVNKGNKRRLVFDAAARIDGESFNSRLLKGPDQYQPKSLLSILFRFRQERIGVCADIKEMFHRVIIRKEDQVAQRFLWREAGGSGPPEQYVMQVMIFGSVSSPCTAQYVKNINAAIYENSHPRAYRAIVECHYVDDYVDSFHDIDEAIAVTREVVRIQNEAGFELRGFVSNSREYLNAVDGGPNEATGLNLSSLCSNEQVTEKILGMFWFPKDDAFGFVLKFTRVPASVLNGDRIPTKSEVLSLTMSIFDPFGALANVVIGSKILLQEMWGRKIDWNSPIPLDIYEKWYEWYTGLVDIQEIRIPRCYGYRTDNGDSHVELHIFVDASEIAFATVAYWRISNDMETRLIFVAGKARCAPIKQLSVPRLELQSAVLGVRLKDSIISSHDMKPMIVTFWSDSKTVIRWIQSDSRQYKPFVAHRISEILDSSTVEQWRWVPGSQNPADEATRPKRLNKDLSESGWLSGPSFLKLPSEKWPVLVDDIGDVCPEEKRTKFVLHVERNQFVPFEKYSSFHKLVRVLAWVLRAVSIFRRGSMGSRLQSNGYLTVGEIRNAKTFLCKVAQKDEFSRELRQLGCERSIPKSSNIYKLSPFLDEEGLIRLSGRIDFAYYVSDETKHPIILPKNHELTKMLVMQYHIDYRHQNQESICAAIRLKYWIPSLRQLVRSAKRHCQFCRNNAAVPVNPLMGQHPRDRLEPYVRPFSYTGLDYMGPFMVSVGRRCEKRWVALFTCLTVRAIHLELAKDLSTDSVIICIKNFINRRGLPIRIRSDRGTNFIGASKEQFVFEEAKVGEECVRRGIEWVFNTPANPSAGGAWERMVRSVKRVLAVTLKEKTPPVETLQCLLIEAENLVNSRPLTHLPVESVDCDPLTPNHFLLGCPNVNQTPAVPEGVCLRRQWQIVQQMKQVFWKRWVLEYLPDLTRRTKWHQPVRPLEVGNVVVICDDSEARGEWKKGVVEEVFAAADGQVHSAVVRTTSGRLRRPASKLAVLDIGGESPRSTHGWWDVTN
ncbi:uncharacterized protein LOC142226096 [Haematobia irritans]|uniref:uncharacterized protein LOC142226096 n=1 Tax=Haematobia irritans TaxID=7368 RepID=UPI003F4FDEA1